MADVELEGDGVLTVDEDEEVTEVVENFELVTTIEQMRKVLKGIKLSLKIREKEAREDETEVREDEKKEDEIEPEPPSPDILARVNGNSAEKIVELEKEYDFTHVRLIDRDQAKKWFKADHPSSSRKWKKTHPEILSAYNAWLRWNISRSGKPI